MNKHLGPVGLVFALGVGLWGTAQALFKGAPDFKVFYAAGKLALIGRGHQIYHETPDRFLYGPGFSWLFSPLAFLPENLALFLWCVFKLIVLFFLIRALGKKYFGSSLARWSLAGWAVIIVARPLLIDFHYGQVNLVILASIVWALHELSSVTKSPYRSFISWSLLAICGLSKVIPIVFFAAPFFFHRLDVRGWCRKGLWAGTLFFFLLPLPKHGFGGIVHLHQLWFKALQDKGFPVETHNQSLAAFLHRLFTDLQIRVIAEGGVHKNFLLFPIESVTINVFSWIWFALIGSCFVVYYLSRNPNKSLEYSPFLIAISSIATYLVWKPYFLYLIPTMVLGLSALKWSPKNAAMIFFFFAGFNLTSYDVAGSHFATWFEVSSGFLWVYLFALFFVLFKSRQLLSLRARGSN